MNFKYFSINFSGNGWLGEKGGREIQKKNEYLENEKSFKDEIKIIFHDFLGLSSVEKKKNIEHKL